MAAVWVLTMLFFAFGTVSSDRVEAGAAPVIVNSQACDAGVCPSQQGLSLMQSMVVAGHMGPMPAAGPVSTPDDGDGEFFTNEEESIDDDEEAEESLALAFAACDLDASGSLSAEEIHHGIFDGRRLQELKVVVNASHGQAPKMNISKRAAALDLGAAQHLISLYDADRSGTLSKAEFLAALVNKHAVGPQPAGLIQTGNMAKCAVDVVEKVWDLVGCVQEFWQESCNWWNLACWWVRVTRVVGCWVDRFDVVAASFDQCRDMVVEAVKDAAAGVAKGFMDLLDPGCTSPESCRDALVSAPLARLLGPVRREIEKAASSLLGEELRPGVPFVMESLSKAPALAAEASGAAAQSATAVTDLAKSSEQAVAKYAKDMGDLCCGAGRGFWYIAPTDCGAFEQLKKISIAGGLHQIHENFAKTVERFLQCITKTRLLNLPSPFMDIKVESYCLPQFLQTPIKGVVGAFQHFIGQLRAGEGDCQGVGSDDRPLCALVVDIQNIGFKLKEILDKKAALLQAAAGAGAQRGPASGLAAGAYPEDCAGKDFKVFLEFGTGVSFPQPSGEPLGFTIAFEGGVGCKNREPFFDLSLGFGIDRTARGADLPIAGSGPSLAIGFDAGTPQEEVFGTSATLKLAGGISLKAFGIPVEGTSELGLNILPQIDRPRGFKVTPPMSTAVLLQAQDATQRAVQSAEGYDIKVLAAIAGLSRSLARADLASQFEQIPRPHALLQQGAAAGSNLNAAARSSVMDLSLTAGVEFKFCLTCLAGTNDTEPVF